MRQFFRGRTVRRNLVWVVGVATGLVAGGAVAYALSSASTAGS